MFSGVSEINLDAKGRMAMPTRYRERLADCCEGKLFVTIDPLDKCLTLHTKPEWDLVQEKIVALPSYSQSGRLLRRTVLGHATEVDMDGNGRLLLSAPLRDFAEIDRRVVLLGQGNKFEIWSEHKWLETRDAYMDSSADTEAVLGELNDLSL
ncbi:MAG: division/cell wall cluster transcriptional repressor MraZ [Halopseudomonas sp.]